VQISRLYVALSEDIFYERTTILEAYEKPSEQVKPILIELGLGRVNNDKAQNQTPCDGDGRRVF
jgi:hypothetical protein